MKEKIGVIGVAVSTANLIIGASIFTIPFGLRLCGWMGIPVAILGSAMLCFTALLLGSVLSEAEARGHDQPSFGEIGMLAFGPKFQIPLAAMCLGELVSVGTCFNLLINDAGEHTFGVRSMAPVTFALCSVIALVP